METVGGCGNETGSVTKKTGKQKSTTGTSLNSDFRDKDESNSNTARWRTPALVPQRRTFVTCKRGTSPQVLSYEGHCHKYCRTFSR